MRLATIEPAIRRRALPSFQSAPVIITGTSGAGKTRLWQTLTGNPYSQPEPSEESDDGMLARRKRASVALRTVPGQDCRQRWRIVRDVFEPRAQLRGVVFVASYGHDHIWAGGPCDVLASTLNPFTIASLRSRNRDKELGAFRDICRQIGDKNSYGEEKVKWILVLVNKADLYWGDLDAAGRYYSAGGQSLFGEEVRQLAARTGATGPKYYVLPCAQRPEGYRFDSATGILTEASVLSQDQCDVSMALVKAALEELCD